MSPSRCGDQIAGHKVVTLSYFHGNLIEGASARPALAHSDDFLVVHCASFAMRMHVGGVVGMGFRTASVVRSFVLSSVLFGGAASPQRAVRELELRISAKKCFRGFAGAPPGVWISVFDASKVSDLIREMWSLNLIRTQWMLPAQTRCLESITICIVASKQLPRFIDQDGPFPADAQT